jgi:PleD family two-component response regulator
MSVTARLVPDIVASEPLPRDSDFTIRRIATLSIQCGASVREEVAEALDCSLSFDLNRPSMIVFECALTSAERFEVMAHLRQLERLRYVPTVVVSSTIDESWASQGFRTSTTGFLATKFEPEHNLAKQSSIVQDSPIITKQTFLGSAGNLSHAL